MDLSLLKQFADDGLAKHKSFNDLKDVISSIESLEQYIEELKARSKALEGAVVPQENRIAKINKDVADAEAKAKLTIEDLAKQVVKANEDYDSKIQALKVRHAEVLSLLDNGEARLREQAKQIQESVATEQSRLAKEFTRLDELHKVKIQSLQTQIQSWEEKLAASKLAYDNFIANLPK